MENLTNEHAKNILFKEKKEEKIEPEKFQAREYRNRYVRVEAYKLPEDSKIHCADGKTFTGEAGDFYVCLDQVHEFILPPDIFRKLFLLKVEE